MKLLGWAPNSLQASLPVTRDAVLLLILYLFNFFTFSAYTQLAQVPTKPWLLLVWLYGLVTLVPLFWRDRAPVAIFVVQSILIVAAWPILKYYSPVAGLPVALYAIAFHRNKTICLLALMASFIPNGLVAAAVAGFAAEPAQRKLATFISSAIFLVLVAIGACIAGQLTQASHRHIARLERERAAAREAEERKQVAAREIEVIAAERRRIARELHDSVSHAVTVIVLLSSGAARVADTNSVQAKQSLEDIATIAKEAMAELRRLLTVLDNGSSNRNNAATIDGLELQPGLNDLPVLINSARVTGVSVTTRFEGKRLVLSPDVDLIAYRIVQEGLTNVLKHAGKDADPQLRLIWEPQNLLIQIDNGIGLSEAVHSQAVTGGWGLRGLRERVTSIGGSLSAAPHAGAGYRLTAILPVAVSAIPSKLSPAAVMSAAASSRGSENQG
jgi:signal transduction histidine kinase